MLIMVFKLFFLFLFFNVSLSFSEIIYHKNEILVTKLELNSYLEFSKNSFNKDLESNKALKEIILMKNTINFLIKNNPNFISAIDKKIELQFKNINSNNEIIKNFFRFQIIRNEFISDYFQNQFSLKQLENVISSVGELKLPISNNDCLTIERFEDLKNDKYFLKNLYENIRNNTNNYQTRIDEKLFSVCLNSSQLNEIENLIINFVEKKTESKFQEFIYGKLN
tara:strand:+ start:1064 stop:1735 length:672 start_codon:yes stop_codon:yes gene_type:complete